MAARITLAGESLIAQKQAARQSLKVARFIFANVPDLDPNTPVDRAASKPPAEQIVYVYDIPDENVGYVNPNQVVYSSQIGSDIGDWDFNWIGLESDEGVLFAVVYVPLQIKRRNIPPLQIGNNLTRNFLVAFDGAQTLTGITIDAKTWQHDFTVRLAGIDERERLSNRDIFGRACFFGSSMQLERLADAYQVKPGTAYIEGVRVMHDAVLAVVPTTFPCTAWVDVALQREFNDVVVSWNVVFANDRQDYTDSAGTKHYCVAIADLVNTNTINDRRPVEPIDGPLVDHFANRKGDYPSLRARATTKDDVELGNLPNAKSDSFTLDDGESLATSKAVATLWESTRTYVSSFAEDTRLTADQRGLVVIDADRANRSITLPASDAALGVVDFIIHRADNSLNRVTVRTSGSDKIKFHTHLNAAGYGFLVLMGAGDWWHLRSDGAGGWWPIGRLDSTPLGRPVFETTTLLNPGGYGPFNGALFVRAQWPWLWDHAEQSGMLTSEVKRSGSEGCWTRGDGIQTFRGPEGRGEFLRILDEGRGVDAGRTGGSSKLSQNKQHEHAARQGLGLNLSSGSHALLAFENIDVGTPLAGGAVGFEGGSEAYPRHLAYPGRIKLI